MRGSTTFGCSPFSRWQVGDNDLFSCVPRFGVHMLEIGTFDMSVFEITFAELSRMDTQHGCLLTTSYNALTALEAHHDLRLRKGYEVGVYVGISSTDHHVLLRKNHLTSSLSSSSFDATGGAHSVAAGRISFTHGFTGAAMAIDTACSSSLVALNAASTMCHRFCFSNNVACVASVNLLQALYTTMVFERAGMLASDGRCKTLDSAADGYTRAESCIAIYLTDEIEHVVTAAMSAGTILSSAVNQDGRSSSLSAPSGVAQQKVICNAIKLAELERGISGILLHGTGTALGDPIEIGAIILVLKSTQEREGNFLTYSLWR